MNPAFTEWWSVQLGNALATDRAELAAAAFEAGYLAAVKAHDASGCPGIFYRHEFRLMEPKS
jgi:hypothetical protein